MGNTELRDSTTGGGDTQVADGSQRQQPGGPGSRPRSGRSGRRLRVGRIQRWLEGAPFHVNHAVLSDLQGKVSTFVS
ncbi:hypothetical protein ACFZCN_43015, partial [Streptomyces sp. NPDC007960]